MEAAKCPICGERHFGAEHIWPKGEKLKESKAAQIAEPSRTETAVAVRTSAPAKGKFDRVAYQREYMRKRRKGKL